MEESKNKMNISSNSNDLLLQIENELYQIIEYIQNNLINIQNKDKILMKMKHKIREK